MTLQTIDGFLDLSYWITLINTKVAFFIVLHSFLSFKDIFIYIKVFLTCDLSVVQRNIRYFLTTSHI